MRDGFYRHERDRASLSRSTVRCATSRPASPNARMSEERLFHQLSSDPPWHLLCKIFPTAETLPDKGIPVVRRGRKATGQVKPDSRVTEGGGSLPGEPRSPAEGEIPMHLRGGSTRCWILGFVLAVGGVLLAAAPTHAGILDTSWTAPTTNADGSALTDLASYRVYYGLSSSPCPGSSFVQVAASTPNPAPGQTVTATLTGLSTGSLYSVSVTAVDTNGSESACVPTLSAVARVDFGVTPTATVDFGTVNIGSFADRTFTVQNTGGGTVSGTASVPAPFSVVSGGSFSLVGAGATQAVT